MVPEKEIPKKIVDADMKKVLGDNNKKVNNKKEKEYLSQSPFTLGLRFFKI